MFNSTSTTITSLPNTDNYTTMPSYYNIDTILAEEELIVARPAFDFALLSHLDPDSHRLATSTSSAGRKRARDDTDKENALNGTTDKSKSVGGGGSHALPAGTKIKMPMWALERWAMLGFIRISSLPKHYGKRMKERLEADPVSVDLRCVCVDVGGAPVTCSCDLCRLLFANVFVVHNMCSFRLLHTIALLTHRRHLQKQTHQQIQKRTLLPNRPPPNLLPPPHRPRLSKKPTSQIQITLLRQQCPESRHGKHFPPRHIPTTITIDHHDGRPTLQKL